MTDTEIAFARTFSGLYGEQVLSYLHHITTERVLGPNASESELRFLEAQRFLVRQIENMILRGRGDKK
ncbi:MAG: hypothetical protein UIH99_01955 [Alphaproteobacteria bacterium]|jgi:hypothetical protein|nr:hypothetical protein [Alphaproteobacteria bacterium]